MLSFEDFFIKKNIDLSALKVGEPLLYYEFELHYQEMGEKSFDHTKKYWFNKLRKQYLLTEQISKIQNVKEVPVKSSQSVPASASSIEIRPAGFKPRFKSSVKSPESKLKTEKEIGEEFAKPTEFKPKFRPKTAPVSAKDNAMPSGDVPQVDKEESSPKPTGFKPRFKAGVTSSATSPADPASSDIGHLPESQTEAKGVEQSASENKPIGFKPRFKSGSTTGKAKEDSSLEPEAETKNDKDENSTSESSDHELHDNESATKPTGFKPRFKAGVTKKVDKPKDDD